VLETRGFNHDLERIEQHLLNHGVMVRGPIDHDAVPRVRFRLDGRRKTRVADGAAPSGR
jgi:hypothetical protein